MREESLVGRDEHIGQRDESRQHVILQHLAGEIVEEDACFLLVNVEGRAADVTGFQRVEQGLRFNQRAAAGVDDEDAGLELADRFFIEEVIGLRQQGTCREMTSLSASKTSALT